jgi:hypothetical protein
MGSQHEDNMTLQSLGSEDEDKGSMVFLLSFHQFQRGILLENWLSLMSTLE